MAGALGGVPAINAHAAPLPWLSPKSPQKSVFPSADRAREEPCSDQGTSSARANLEPCCVQIPPLRVNTHVAPVVEKLPPGPAVSSLGPPTAAVFPSADNATPAPCRGSGPTAPLPTNLEPCWVQTPLLLVNTHTAPSLLLSAGPPTRAVFPSEDSATAAPCLEFPAFTPVPTSLGPCWVHMPPLRANTHTAPI